MARGDTQPHAATVRVVADLKRYDLGTVFRAIAHEHRELLIGPSSLPQSSSSDLSTAELDEATAHLRPVCVAKHLCGNASDYAVQCMRQTLLLRQKVGPSFEITLCASSI